MKEQETMLTVGEAAERAQICTSDRWAHLSLCKFGINTPLPCYPANYSEYVIPHFFHTSLLHNTLLCFYFNPLFLLTSLQIMFIVLKFPVHVFWRVLLIHSSYISKQKKKISTLLFYSQWGKQYRQEKGFSGTSLPDVEDVTSVHTV